METGTCYINTTKTSKEIQSEVSIPYSGYDKYEGCVITSAVDGKHSKGSKHYIGYALDIRSRNMTSNGKLSCTKQLKVKLGNEFDIVLEKDHIHLEFDPESR